MKTNIRTLVSFSICAMIAAGCSSTGKLAREQAGYPRERVDARGLYAENCARCHSEDGRAKTLHGRVLGAQDFTDAQWHKDTSNEEIIHAIKTGPKKMPAFEGKLSEPEIEALAAYVQTFNVAQ
ncbi:MAG TPA: cytochrome c [Verrucomicrobiae bacterium]|jgi:mono/diheme cytochrome c family protein|nr:cytochrome c [Verrucomicrobiae bacterium]